MRTLSASASAADANAASDPAAQRDAAAARRRGWWLGIAGVLMFALTLPMTRLAGGTAQAPQLPPEFVAVARAAVAGLLSVAWLMWRRAPWPSRHQWALLAASGGGVVFGFPLFLGWAVLHVDATHAAVITGLLPLATALVAALWLRQHPRPAFWGWALAGCALVLGYAVARGGGQLQTADLLLLGAVAAAAVGYVGGARVAALGMAPEQVICWMLVLALPITLPLGGWLGWRDAAALAAARPAAWGAFAYVSTVSMWFGFFAWYRGLALGGALQVSQVQLLQPFAAMLAAVPLLGERIDALSLGFALAVLAVVVLGRRSAQPRVPPSPKPLAAAVAPRRSG